MTILKKSEHSQRRDVEQMYDLLYEEQGYKCFNDVDIFERVNINLEILYKMYTALYTPDMEFFDYLISIEWDECIR